METDDLFHSTNDFHTKGVVAGNATYDSKNFELMKFRNYYTTKVVDDNGLEKELERNETLRNYLVIKTLGFTKIGIFGATLGAFSRKDKLKTEDY